VANKTHRIGERASVEVGVRRSSRNYRGRREVRQDGEVEDGGQTSGFTTIPERPGLCLNG